MQTIGGRVNNNMGGGANQQQQQARNNAQIVGGVSILILDNQ